MPSYQCSLDLSPSPPKGIKSCSWLGYWGVMVDLNLSRKSILSIVTRLAFTYLVYQVWTEENNRIFQQKVQSSLIMIQFILPQLKLRICSWPYLEAKALGCSLWRISWGLIAVIFCEYIGNILYIMHIIVNEITHPLGKRRRRSSVHTKSHKWKDRAFAPKCLSFRTHHHFAPFTDFVSVFSINFRDELQRGGYLLDRLIETKEPMQLIGDPKWHLQIILYLEVFQLL